MSLPSELLPVGLLGTGAAQTGYQIERSLRFNSSDSAYLSRTPASAGNRKTWTWAGWVKRGNLAGSQGLFTAGTTNNNVNPIYFGYLIPDSIAILHYANAFQYQVETGSLFRDPSAWYHVVIAFDTTQATSTDRIKIFVNGVRQTNFATSNFPSQNQEGWINSTDIHGIGAVYVTGTGNFNGYLADVHFIDGQALDPTSFGEFDDNGIWQPKAYTGTYGTNGFYLDFADNSSTAALGYDAAGSNDWSVNNFSVTAGVNNDSLVDVPTNGAQTDTGVGGEVRGNYCTLNPLDNTTTLTDGNLNTNNSGSNDKGCRGTIAITSGKWYWEVTNVTAGSVGSNASQIGISISSGSLNSYVGFHAGGYSIDTQNGNKFNNASGSSYLSGGSAANSVHGVAFDADNGTITFYRNGSTPGTAFSSIPAGTYFPAISNYASNCVANFGQRPFAYTSPSGYKALCTANLPAPTIKNGSAYMDVVLDTGANILTSAQSTLGGSADLLWIKDRANTNNHQLIDTVRGGTATLQSNTDVAETTYSAPSGSSVAWTWDAGNSTVTNNDGTITSSVRANASAGFSIVTYAGTASNSDTVGHGLGVTPSFVIIKNRSAARSWVVRHKILTSTQNLYLNSTVAATTASGTAYGGVGATTSSTFGFIAGTSDASNVNASGNNYVAYCFAAVEGYSAFGSYTGNNSTDGPFVYTGFRPKWILFKSSSTGGTNYNWMIKDANRPAYNPTSGNLYANFNIAEDTTSTVNIDILSNGFKLRGTYTSINANAVTYIYAAFAENPFSISRAR